MWVVRGWPESVKEWGSMGAIEGGGGLLQRLGFGKGGETSELLEREREHNHLFLLCFCC